MLLSSCSKDDDNTPVIPNEEEIITSLIYTLVPDNGGDNVILSFRDLDGDGGNAPVISTSPLAQNTSYQGRLVLLNESVTPSEEINGEITEEDEEHQFFFQTQGGAVIDLSYDDQDSNGNPIGLETRLTTTEATQGQLVITLRHEPNKTADGVKDGLIGNAGGETDIEVSFELTVQ
ncbi:MAG: type 1 periplasmic binding fold superfamily protein [Saprospiraceae bacterium]